MAEITECDDHDRDEFWQDSPPALTTATETGAAGGLSWAIGEAGEVIVTDPDALKELLAYLAAYDGELTEGEQAMSTTENVLAEVAAERVRQDEKWGEQNHRDADPILLDRVGGVTPLRLADEHGISSGSSARSTCRMYAARGQNNFLAILVEEVGEASDEIAKGNTAALREELIQVAAVAVQWVEAIDRRTEGEQA